MCSHNVTQQMYLQPAVTMLMVARLIRVVTHSKDLGDDTWQEATTHTFALPINELVM